MDRLPDDVVTGIQRRILADALEPELADVDRVIKRVTTDMRIDIEPPKRGVYPMPGVLDTMMAYRMPSALLVAFKTAAYSNGHRCSELLRDLMAEYVRTHPVISDPDQ